MEGAAEGQNVGIIMLSAVFNCTHIITKRSTDTPYLVAYHGGSDSGTVYHDTSVSLSPGYIPCHLLSVIGIVDTFF